VAIEDADSAGFQDATLNGAAQLAATAVCTYAGALTYTKCHCIGSTVGAD
jgi:hypothetical protein